MASRSRSMSFATTLESPPLSKNRATVPFANSFPDSCSIFSNVLERQLGVVGAVVNLCTHLANSLRRFVSSGSPSTVDVVMLCLSLSNWGMRSPIFSLTSSKCCNRSGSVVGYGKSVDRYLVMFDERVHAT